MTGRPPGGDNTDDLVRPLVSVGVGDNDYENVRDCADRVPTSLSTGHPLNERDAVRIIEDQSCRLTICPYNLVRTKCAVKGSAFILSPANHLHESWVSAPLYRQSALSA